MNAPLPTEEVLPPGLLHNMSMRPTTAIQFVGAHRCRARRFRPGEALAALGIAAGDTEALARHLGVAVAPGESADDALIAFVDATLRACGLPPVAPVLVNSAISRLGCDDVDDLALAVALASKSSRSVFVREKRAILSEIWKHHEVVLLLPETVATAACEEKR